ncbi:MAG: dihydrodipicolinate reductase [Thermoprotei archaeon]|nr:MAG: dihydrodipicolinate reductase [Thermoprotei archaeon]
MSVRIGIYGFGAIGRLIARAALDRGYEIVGAVDINPEIVGKDVGELIGRERLGVSVSRDPDTLVEADVVLHATGSYLDRVYDQLLRVIDLGIDVISTCETLSYPYYRYPVLARRLDAKARSHGVTVLGTGINPGFLLDTLVTVLTAPFHVVKRIKAVRSLDASKRRLPFQKKVGIGLDPDVYREKLAKGELTGHVGYAESVLLIADAAGLQPSRVAEHQEPVVAEEDVKVGTRVIGRGKVLGARGYGAAYVGDREVIRIEFIAYAGAEEYELIEIEGKEYTVTWKSSGTPGDMGTVSVLLNLVDAVLESGPGLITMADLVPFRPKLVP